MIDLAELRNNIQQRKVILFVGAGVSATLGMANWSELIALLAQDLGIDGELFRMHGDPAVLAEYFQSQQPKLHTLKEWMEKAISGVQDKLQQSEIYRAICDLNFPTIYTTNYDTCLEDAFLFHQKPACKIVGIADFAKAKSGATHIIKYHGDFEDEKSIVLSESSYFARMDFDTPLDIRLRADCLEKSVLYIGYSLSDTNVRFLWYKLDSIWKKCDDPSHRPKSYIFMGFPNWIQEEVYKQRGIFPIHGNSPDQGQCLLDFLVSLRDG